jgi:formyltetrahydrofolate hydrolase
LPTQQQKQRNRILLIDCPDRAGLIHEISGVLFRHGANIVSNSEFVDRGSGRFFMRTEFAGSVVPDGALRDEVRGLLPAEAEAAQVRLASSSGEDQSIVVLVPRSTIVWASCCCGTHLGNSARGFGLWSATIPPWRR